VPQLRATPEPFRPTLVERLGTRTPDLEALVHGMYVRGLSTQDVSDLYGEAFGASRLSKSHRESHQPVAHVGIRQLAEA
jgi:transposase-like protein